MNEIIYLGEALQYFVNNAEIYIYQNNIKIINLMNYFPIVKRGFTTRRTIYNLLYIYEIYHFDQTSGIIIPDNLFMKAFGINIPAIFYRLTWKDDPMTGVVIDEEIFMQQALESRLISQPLNTFQVIELNDRLFNPTKIESYFLFDIADYNSYTLNYINEAEEILGNNELMNHIIIEKQLSDELSIIYGDNLEKLNFHDFITSAMDNNIINIINHIVADPWIHLLIVIITEDIDAINNLLTYVDPRKNHNIAYKLSLTVGNQDIINLLKNNIIQQTFYERQVLTEGFEPLIGPSNIPQTLYTYSR